MSEQTDRLETFHRVAEVLHCKWTLAVLDAIDRGSVRPSEIKDALPGLSDKVLGERLRKLERYGVLEREAFAEVPPRVEYTLTDQGRELAELVRKVAAFADRWAHDPGS